MDHDVRVYNKTCFLFVDNINTIQCMWQCVRIVIASFTRHVYDDRRWQIKTQKCAHYKTKAYMYEQDNNNNNNKHERKVGWMEEMLKRSRENVSTSFALSYSYNIWVIWHRIILLCDCTTKLRVPVPPRTLKWVQKYSHLHSVSRYSELTETTTTRTQHRLYSVTECTRLKLLFE